MISANCDIQEFISELANKSYFEMIYLLDKEATAAERQLFKPKTAIAERPIRGPEYVNKLKNLIYYLRYGAKPRGLCKEDIQLFDSVCKTNDSRLRNSHFDRQAL